MATEDATRTVAVVVDDDRDTQLLALDTNGGSAWPQANLVLDHVGTVQPRLDLRAAIENRLRARRVRVEAPVVLWLALPPRTIRSPCGKKQIPSSPRGSSTKKPACRRCLVALARLLVSWFPEDLIPLGIELLLGDRSFRTQLGQLVDSL